MALMNFFCVLAYIKYFERFSPYSNGGFTTFIVKLYFLYDQEITRRRFL